MDPQIDTFSALLLQIFNITSSYNYKLNSVM
jgi:hypothetical protein